MTKKINEWPPFYEINLILLEHRLVVYRTFRNIDIVDKIRYQEQIK